MYILFSIKKLKTIVTCTVFFILLITKCHAEMPSISCNSVCPNTPLKYRSNKSIPSNAKCVMVGQNRIYYRILGSGQPTIIFSSGTGFPSDGWFESGIANTIAKQTSIFTYDRVFTFNSCPNPNNYMPITAHDVVAQLRQLLKQENIYPPYILVGHSIGGLYMLLYAREFPKEVAGLVLLDATSDAGPTPLPQESKEILKKLGNPQNATPDNPLYNEMIGQLPSYLQMKNAPPLPNDMPLIVMYATKHCLPLAWTHRLMCMTPKQEKEHEQQQLAIYNMSNNHYLIAVPGDHMVFFNPNGKKIVLKTLEKILKISRLKGNF